MAESVSPSRTVMVVVCAGGATGQRAPASALTVRTGAAETIGALGVATLVLMVGVGAVGATVVLEDAATVVAVAVGVGVSAARLTSANDDAVLGIGACAVEAGSDGRK